MDLVGLSPSCRRGETVEGCTSLVFQLPASAARQSKGGPRRSFSFLPTQRGRRRLERRVASSPSPQHFHLQQFLLPHPLKPTHNMKYFFSKSTTRTSKSADRSYVSMHFSGTLELGGEKNTVVKGTVGAFVAPYNNII